MKPEDIRWSWVPEDQAAAGRLPEIRTDVSLTADDRRFNLGQPWQAIQRGPAGFGGVVGGTAAGDLNEAPGLDS